MSNYPTFIFIVVFGIITCFTACGPNYVYEIEQPIGETGWTYADSLVTTFEIADTNQIYNLHLFVDHTTDFSSQNVYVKVHTIFPDGERLSEEVSLELARSSGAWYGDCTADACSLAIPLQEGAYFNKIGSYSIVIEQFSRINPLPSIQRIGFALEATDAHR